MRGIWSALVVVLTLAGCTQQDAATAPVAAPETGPVRIVTFQGDDTLTSAPGPVPVTIRPTGFPGPEPTVGVTSAGNVFVLASEKTLRSADRGATWEVVLDYEELYPREPLYLGSTDPYLFVDPGTDRVFTDHMQQITCTNLLWSDDEGATWTQRPQACGTPYVDFPKVAAGPPGPDPNPLAGVRHPSVVYLCYNKIVFPAFTTTCAVSYDGGLTFPVERQALAMAFVFPVGTGVGSCAGGASAPTIAPDGTAFIVACGGFGTATSRDSGLTWTPATFPEDFETLGGSVAFSDYGADGTLHLISVGAEDGRAYLHTSSDHGATWSLGHAVSPPGLSPVSFPTVVAGEAGRVAMAFLGTRDETAEPSEVAPSARWHAYVVTTDDALAASPTFRAIQATPDEDPVQVGPICLGGASCGEARNLLDFISAAAGPDGTPYVVIADGCVGECVAAPSAEASRAQEATLLVLDDWRLS